MLIPATPIEFTYFRLPSAAIKWSPSYSLIEKESLVTISGEGFIPSMLAKCLFPGSPCSSLDGTELNPCEREATYISPTGEFRFAQEYCNTMHAWKPKPKRNLQS